MSYYWEIDGKVNFKKKATKEEKNQALAVLVEIFGSPGVDETFDIDTFFCEMDHGGVMEANDDCIHVDTYQSFLGGAEEITDFLNCEEVCRVTKSGSRFTFTDDFHNKEWLRFKGGHWVVED